MGGSIPFLTLWLNNTWLLSILLQYYASINIVLAYLSWFSSWHFKKFQLKCTVVHRLLVDKPSIIYYRKEELVHSVIFSYNEQQVVTVSFLFSTSGEWINGGYCYYDYSKNEWISRDMCLFSSCFWQYTTQR